MTPHTPAHWGEPPFDDPFHDWVRSGGHERYALLETIRRKDAEIAGYEATQAAIMESNRILRAQVLAQEEVIGRLWAALARYEEAVGQL